MALSSGQINDAYQAALGRMATQGEISQYSGDNSLEGDPGKNALISRLNPSKASSSGGGGSNVLSNPLDLVKQTQALQLEANKPAIQTLTTQKNDLDTKYKDLLSSITASEQPATNNVIRNTNNELGRRGIMADSGVGATEIANAQIPVATQFAQLKANTGLSRQQDLGNIAGQIASLEAGNVPSALGFASGIGGLQNQAQSIANSYTLGKEQLAASQKAEPERYIPVGGSGLYDTKTGKVIQGIDAIKSSVNNDTGW